MSFYVGKLTEGIATLAAAFYPKPVIVRLSDFKSNEYSSLVGGKKYEPDEENPMLGFRGASRYIASSFRACFELECRALRKVRDDMGLTNVEVMVPFVRNVEEAARTVSLLADNGLKRGVNGLKVIMMCEIPSNALLADSFLDHFDGFSIGSNDLTQLTLGLDRDSGIVADAFDERDPAVKMLLSMAIRACRARGKYVGHLRTGSVRSPGSRAVAGGAGDRHHLAQSRHGRGHVAVPREGGTDRAQDPRMSARSAACLAGFRVSFDRSVMAMRA